MSFPPLADIEDALALQPESHLGLNIAVLRNITFEGIESYLRYAGMQDGLRLQLHWGDYDNILQEANGMASCVVNQQTQAIIVALWLPAFSEILSFSFASFNAEQIEAEVLRVRDYCIATIEALRKRTRVPILWLGFEPPIRSCYGIMDATICSSQRCTIASLNASLKFELAQAGNAWLVNISACLESVGALNFYDWRYWHIAHAPYSRQALAEIAIEIQKHLRAETGRVRKCLILDCDNTLWGGIIGEDGLNGIRIGTEHPGIAYREFQLEILNLYHRGVVLGLCSKNNEDDVLSVLRSHTGMVLREENFSVLRVNWQDKPTNLREIATELNIGLESIVFVDDNAFEINMVRDVLPEVTTLHVSRSKPYENRGLLSHAGWFDTHSLTEEDRVRNKMYLSEVARKNFSASNISISQYLMSLEINLFIEPVTEAQLDRATQLCQRTNQFNLTTKRYSRTELAMFLASSTATLLLLRLSDRFGDYGYVGFCLLTHDGESAHIDTFLMSCRALGRQVETAFLALCTEAASGNGASIITADYVPTVKNAQVADFYQRHGFKTESKSGSKMRFIWHCKPDSINVPEHFIQSASSQIHKSN